MTIYQECVLFALSSFITIGLVIAYIEDCIKTKEQERRKALQHKLFMEDIENQKQWIDLCRKLGI